jgi:hypothetical protein
MLEVLFGTFTNDPFRGVALRTLKIAGAVSDALSSLKETVTDGIISLFAWGAKQLTDPATDAMVDDAAALLKEWDKKEATNFARAGRLNYFSYVIEEALRKQILEKRRHLPHHTLVAKDHDVGQPEVRLAYKIACSLACDVTTDMLIAYYRGDSHDGCRQVLHDRYYHPAMLLDRGIQTNHFANTIEALYGDRWWQFSEAKDGRIYVG